MMFATLTLPLASCSDDNKVIETETDANYVGKATGNFTADEWYPGGKLGTTDNATAGCYEDETKAVTGDMLTAFHKGEALFERNYNTGSGAFKGLGSIFICLPRPDFGVRHSCICA